ncbi:hypothetical protein C8J57DRAFT_1514739 [Mycena rebaudengoi]|nr:hypothetical protein C8J57DRAFT_1514739 [Mycena rebaudengoi]
MSRSDFISSVKVSGPSAVRDRQKLKLTALSIAVFVMAGQQTSGWNTLLTPQVFDHKTGVTGSELDLSSPLLPPFLSSGALDFCVFNSSNLPGFDVGQTESGYASVNRDLKVPISFTLMDFAFNTSTAGILPLSFDDTNDVNGILLSHDAPLGAMENYISGVAEYSLSRLSVEQE